MKPQQEKQEKTLNHKNSIAHKPVSISLTLSYNDGLSDSQCDVSLSSAANFTRIHDDFKCRNFVAFCWFLAALVHHVIDVDAVAAEALIFSIVRFTKVSPSNPFLYGIDELTLHIMILRLKKNLIRFRNAKS